MGLVFRFFGLDVRIEIWTLILGGIFYFDALIYIREQIRRFCLREGLLKFAAVGGMITVVVSLFLHELAHTIVGRLVGLSISEITLTWWGGYVIPKGASFFEAPLRWVVFSLAGPLMNFAIALVCAFFVASWGESLLENTIQYVSFINIRLGKFNLLPILVFDGGKALWGLATWMFGQEPGFFIIMFASVFTILWSIFSPKGKRRMEDGLKDL